MTDQKIRLLLADDHAVFRSGLRLLLSEQPDMEVVGEAADGEEAIRKTKELNPDILLLDITMPGISGLEALDRIKKEPRRAIDLFGALFARKIGADLVGMATGEAIAHANCLIGRGLARRVVDSEGVARYVST